MTFPHEFHRIAERVNLASMVIPSLLRPQTEKYRMHFNLLNEALDRGIDGDVIECGVYKGAVTCLLASVLAARSSTRRVFALDSFEGLPAPNASEKYYKLGDFADTSATAVREKLSELRLMDRCELVQGWFDETLPSLSPDLRFSYVHIDADLEQSYRLCISQLYPRLSVGGTMVFDDYLDMSGEARQVVNEFVRETGDLLQAGPCGPVFVIKGQTARETAQDHVVDGLGGPIGIDYFVRHREATRDLRQELKVLRRVTDTLGSWRDYFERVQLGVTKARDGSESDAVCGMSGPVRPTFVPGPSASEDGR